MSQFKITAFNADGEPYNSDNKFDTPKYPNIGEEIYFSYASTGGEIVLTGLEKWVFDFDYNSVTRDQPLQELYGFTGSLPVSFSREGDREVDIKVYDRKRTREVKVLGREERTADITVMKHNPFDGGMIMSESGRLKYLDSSNNIISDTAGTVSFISDYSLTSERFFLITGNTSFQLFSAETHTVVYSGTLSYAGSVLIDAVPYNNGWAVLATRGASYGSVVYLLDSSGAVQQVVVGKNAVHIIADNNKVYTINKTDGTVSAVTSTGTVTEIPVNDVPLGITADNDNYLYVRSKYNVDIIDTFIDQVVYTLTVDDHGYTTSVVTDMFIEYSPVTGDIYIGSKYSIQKMSSETWDITSLKYSTTKTIREYMYDKVLDYLYISYNSSTEFINPFSMETTDTLPSIYSKFIERNYTTGYLYLNDFNDKFYILRIDQRFTDSFMTGDILYQDTVQFSVYKFPSFITGADYASEGETVVYSLDSGEDAESIVWYKDNEEVSTSGSYSTVFEDTRLNITAVVTNGYKTVSFEYTTKLSLLGGVEGERYEGDITDNLLFFNKEGDCLNMTYNEGVWESDMLFHHNSDDTFKTASLYVFEKVDPIYFTDESIETRKVQFFNQNGVSFRGGSNIISITQVEPAKSGYGKWLTVGQHEIRKGDELYISDIHSAEFEYIGDTEFITGYTEIAEFSTVQGNEAKFFTVYDTTKDKVLVMTETENTLFDYDYRYGEFRDINNKKYTIPQGTLQKKNIVKVYNIEDSDEEWNEPYLIDLLYDRKKLSVLNNVNEGIYTVNKPLNNDNIGYINKKKKVSYIGLNELIEDNMNFGLTITKEVGNIKLSDSLVDFIPQSYTEGFLSKDLIVWEKDYKDHTPALLQGGVEFFIDGDIKEYRVQEQGFASVVIGDIPQPKIYKVSFEVFEDGQQFIFSVGKTEYIFTEGQDYQKGNSTTDAVNSLYQVLDAVPEISVFKKDEYILFYGKVYNIIFGNVWYTVSDSVMSTNSPEYGVVGGEIQYLTEQHAGYIHYREHQDMYYILCFDGQEILWYPLSGTKKVVSVYASDDIDYEQNVSRVFWLTDNKVDITSAVSSDDKSKRASAFAEYNRDKAYDLGINLYIENNNIIAEDIYTTDTKDYNTVAFFRDSTVGYAGSSSFHDVGYIEVLEELEDSDSYVEAENYEQKVVVKNIDTLYGLTVTINGGKYHTPYSSADVGGVTDPDELAVLNTEETLFDWGNARLSEEDALSPEYVGIPFHQVLEMQGVITYLEKSGEGIVQGVSHYDTLVIQSKYPSVSIDYSIDGLLEYKIMHSRITVYDIFGLFVITLDGVRYSTVYNTSVEQTLIDFVDMWGGSFEELGIYLTADGDSLDVGCLEDINPSYSVYVGKNNTLHETFYTVEPMQKGEESVIISGNEILNSYADFQTLGFSTGMVTSVSNTKYILNSKEYNIIFVDPSVIGLSYQGAFFDDSESLGTPLRRSGFDWSEYSEYIGTDVSGYEFGTASAVTVYHPPLGELSAAEVIGDSILFAGDGGLVRYINNSYTQLLPICDFFKYNSYNGKVYAVQRNISTVFIFDGGNLIAQVGTTAFIDDIAFDGVSGDAWVLNTASKRVTVINGTTNNIYGIIYSSYFINPSKITFDPFHRYMVVSDTNRYHILRCVSRTYMSFRPVSGLNEKIEFDSVSNKMIGYTADNYVIINNMNLSFSYKAMPESNITASVVSGGWFYGAYLSGNIIKYSITLDEAVDIGGVSVSDEILVLGDNIIKSGAGFTEAVSESIMSTTFYASEQFSELSRIAENKFISVNSSSGYIFEASEVFEYSTTAGISSEDILLTSREFLRYPRERFDGDPKVQYKFSWESANDDIFMYDFSGEQLYIEYNDKRMLDYKQFNYIGTTPLLENGEGVLNRKYNKDIEKIKDPAYQQTVFEEMWFNARLIDDEEEISPNPEPIQVFCGFRSSEEGVSERTLVMERHENIEFDVKTEYRLKNQTEYEWFDIVDFRSGDNTLYVRNRSIDFKEEGLQAGQVVELSGFDNLNDKNQGIFKNGGFRGTIKNVSVNSITFETDSVLKDDISYKTVRSIIPPFKETDSAFTVKIRVMPSTVAKIAFKGDTEIEDIRYKTLLDNFGINIKHSDIFIFDDYDIKEEGVDWTYVNKKRKELLLMYPEIYNYIGSYKALINAVNYFGYEDLELFEYYLNKDKDSPRFGHLHKVEIPDIFSRGSRGYTEDDSILKAMPTRRYKKTKLFNLTYRITDWKGEYVLNYSLDEIIIKLIGLKKWLRENIMPIGTRLKDITGRGEDLAQVHLTHNMRNCVKFNMTETLDVADFDAEAYLQPVENNSETYVVRLSFNEDIPENFTVNIKTFSTPDYTAENFELSIVQNISYYKTDSKAVLFTVDRTADPFIQVETVQDNGYGAVYKNKKTYSLEKLAFLK